MISAVDTNVLLDVFLPDKRFAEQSAGLLKVAYDEGALLICEIVYAELVPQFNDRHTLDSALATLNITISPSSPDVAFLAGERWGQYRKAGGARKRIVTDFLIGAHAAIKAERFLTRDRGLYKSYFEELIILS
jgi:predicted nucleic acid-binding protein